MDRASLRTVDGRAGLLLEGVRGPGVRGGCVDEVVEPLENMAVKNDEGLCLVGVTCDWLLGSGRTKGESPSRLSIGDSNADRLFGAIVVVATVGWGTVTV